MPLDVFLMNMCVVVIALLIREKSNLRSEINYENTNFKRALHSKYPCYYSFTNASYMSMVTSSTQILINNLIELIS